ncbi:MAG: ATP-dependent metallopeptidase FtsH/Yme1/Tma family protein [Alphaproteobacteria bacterium]|nr:ATP-dependent metallopeptidase FtsH/Yme1/Tma family protein [Alphaproteobacteria bacterium]
MNRNLALWIIIGLFLVAIFNLFQAPPAHKLHTNIAYSSLLHDAKEGRVKKIHIRGNVASGELNDGSSFSTTIPPQNTTLADRLSDLGVFVEVENIENEMPSFLQILLGWLPMILLIGVWIFFMRQMQSGGNKAMGFGKSKARLLDDKATQVTFKDVAGVDEAKQELEEVVEFLRDPQKFQRLGGKIPRGLLLVGPPGTGKTLLARAIAGEAGVPFFTISGSDFVEMFVGVGASRVRDLFEQGKKNAPCIIFIDEIDAVGRHRGAGLGGGNDEREQTLNQLLVEMDGFEANDGVILIAATNRPDVLDPALLRPGRFDRQVVVPNPDVIGREKILAVHSQKVPMASNVDLMVIARGTPGFSGADLANLINEGALLAARRNRRTVSMAELEEAKDKVMMGSERRSMVMTEEEKRLTAYHESGHAVVAFHSPASDPIHKATIIPRGRALGMVMRLPEGDRVSMSRERLYADLAVAMGGRIAEEMIFGYEKITTGASSDISMATQIARRMVTEWGMSDKLGPITYGENTQEVFLGHSVAQHKNVSESTAQIIDEEIKRIIHESYERAKHILTKYRKHLELLATTLLEFETLSGEDINVLLKEGKLDRIKPSFSDIPPSSSIPSGGKKAPKATKKTVSKKAGKQAPEPQAGV